MIFKNFYQVQGEIETKRLSLPSGIIHSESIGQGAPVLLLHGLSGSGRWWRRNLAFLANRFRVHTLDMVGFGRSRGQPFELMDAGRIVVEWMDYLEIDRAHILGHSMGGYIAIDLAANYPDRAGRIVLVDALALPMDRSYLRTAVRLAHALRYMPFNFLPVLVGDAFLAGPSTLLKAGRKILAVDIRAELHRIHSPVLVVWGEKDTLLPVQLGKLLNRHLPNSKLLVIPGAGHNPMWDRPKSFNEAVGEFLASDNPLARYKSVAAIGEAPR